MFPRPALVEVIKSAYPEIEIVEGTHKPLDKTVFRNDTENTAR